jgi:hypothetical protein
LAEAPEEETAEPLPTTEEVFAKPPVFFQPVATEGKTELRFAEDIMAPRPDKVGDKAKKKKKKGAHAKDSAEDGIKLKKRRRGSESFDEEEEY